MSYKTKRDAFNYLKDHELSIRDNKDFGTVYRCGSCGILVQICKRISYIMGSPSISDNYYIFYYRDGLEVQIDSCKAEKMKYILS